MKTCKLCNEKKENSLFEKNRLQCKECRKKYYKQYRENNQDKIIKWRINNKDKILQDVKEYRKNNKDKISKMKKKYYQKHKPILLIKNNTYKKNNKNKISKQRKEHYWNLPKCIKCKLNIARLDYDNHCFRCFCYYFPDDKRIKQKRLYKQHYIHDNIIVPTFSEYLISYDKQIDKSCSKRRPDWYFDLGTHCVILECDENQHFNKGCEEKREMEIFQDLGNRPIIFIRFNPDKYNDNKGCFYFDKDNRFKIRKNEFEKRKGKLIHVLNYWIKYNNIPQKERECIFLYYNN